MPFVNWGTAGIASVTLTIQNEYGDSITQRNLCGCLVKKDANLKYLVEKFIHPLADRNKYERCNYLFYGTVSDDIQGKVTEAKISYEKISKKPLSDVKQKTMTCTVEDPLLIAFHGHVFLCLDSEDLNKSKFLKEKSKEIRIIQTIDPGTSIYGLGIEKYDHAINHLQFMFLNLSQCRSDDAQRNFYKVNDEVVYEKLKEVGPLLLTLPPKNNETVVGYYQKSNGNCRIEIYKFENKGDPEPGPSPPITTEEDPEPDPSPPITPEEDPEPGPLPPIPPEEDPEPGPSGVNQQSAVGRNQNDGSNDNLDGTRVAAEQQENTSASNTDGSMDTPTDLDNCTGQATAGLLPSETGDPSESGESSLSSTEQATSENRLNGSSSEDTARPDHHNFTTENRYVLPPRTTGNFAYAKPIPEEIKQLKEQRELQKENGQLKHENKKLEEHIRELKQLIKKQFEQQKELEVENTRLKQQNDKLEKDEVQSKQQNKELEDDKRRFRKQKKKLNVENKRLKQQNEKLEEEKIQSEEQKEKLEGEIRQRKQQKKLLKEENRQLLRQNEKLEEDKRQYQQQQRKLENKIRQLFRQKNKIKEDRRRYFITSIVLFVIILLIVSVVVTIVVVLVVHHKEAYEQFSIN